MKKFCEGERDLFAREKGKGEIAKKRTLSLLEATLSMMSKVVTSIRKEKCSIGIKRGSS
jgi:hypothetical protein